MVMEQLSEAWKTVRCWRFVAMSLMGLREGLKGCETWESVSPRRFVESELVQLS
jgi:hypothetical protein